MISILNDGLFRAEMPDGTRRMVGLRELLEQAHAITDLCGRSATGRLALLRLCVAFLEDVYAPRRTEDRSRLLAEGRFDGRRIDAYIEACESLGRVFLLDDDRHPFMQAAYDPEMDGKAERPAAAVFMDIPSGNAHIHTDHRRMEEVVADAPDALEGMLETYMFCPSGVQGYPSAVNNVNPVYCVVRGRNLFETLVLNMAAAEELADQVPFGEGMVPWRTGAPVLPREAASTVSFLEAFTWQPRRLTLAFDDDGRVRRVYLQQGRNFTGDGRWRDPWAAYRRHRDGTLASLKPELGRQLWRDADKILAGPGIAPVPIANAKKVWRSIPNGALSVEMTGVIASQASILGVAHETIHIPEALLEDEASPDGGSRLDCFRAWFDITEEMYSVLMRTIAGDYDQKTAHLVGESFLRRMREAIFGTSLGQLVSQAGPVGEEDGKAIRAAFGESLWRALKESLRDVMENSGASVRNIRRQNEIEAKVLGYCARRLKEEGAR